MANITGLSAARTIAGFNGSSGHQEQESGLPAEPKPDGVGGGPIGARYSGPLTGSKTSTLIFERIGTRSRVAWWNLLVILFFFLTLGDLSVRIYVVQSSNSDALAPTLSTSLKWYFPGWLTLIGVTLFIPRVRSETMRGLESARHSASDPEKVGRLTDWLNSSRWGATVLPSLSAIAASTFQVFSLIVYHPWPEWQIWYVEEPGVALASAVMSVIHTGIIYYLISLFGLVCLATLVDEYEAGKSLRDPISITELEGNILGPLGTMSTWAVLGWTISIGLSLFLVFIAPLTEWWASIQIAAFLISVVVFSVWPPLPIRRRVSKLVEAERETLRSNYWRAHAELGRRLSDGPVEGAALLALSQALLSTKVMDERLERIAKWPWDFVTVARLFVVTLLVPLTANVLARLLTR